MRRQILVINYHKIDTGESMTSIDKIFSVTKDSFEKQLNILRKNEVPVVTLENLINDNLSNDFSVAITVDDGNSSDYNIAYPLFKANSMPATFFLLSDNKQNTPKWEHAKEMIKNGFTIGSHGISHNDLTKMKPEVQLYELEYSKKQIEEQIGTPVHYFALPYGLYNSETLELVKRIGYTAVCTIDVKLNSPKNF